jgi:hypothetical protein
MLDREAGQRGFGVGQNGTFVSCEFQAQFGERSVGA